MRYAGGKHQISKHVVEVLNQHRRNRLYIEPFIGALNIFSKMDGPKIGSDANSDLIELWLALRDGWQPPTHVTESQYLTLKDYPPSPLRTFVGFACSFSGKMFHGYARDGTDRNYASNAVNSLRTKLPGIEQAEIKACGYEEYTGATGALIYCDPPYANTKIFKGFDSEKFWAWATEMSKTNTVIVSEFTAPPDWKCIWEKQINRSLRKNGEVNMTEKLFICEPL